MLWIGFSLVVLTFFIGGEALESTTRTSAQASFFPVFCNIRCQRGFKCALVEPRNCFTCSARPQCVQNECDTSCRLSCPFLNRCVLTNTGLCCPVPACRFSFPFNAEAETTPN